MNNYQGPGIYEHFKGGLYTVLGIARNESDLENNYIVYQLYNTKFKTDYYIRTLNNFDEDYAKKPRFKKIKSLER